MVKQVKIFDKENKTICGGILLENGSVLCGCCGSIFESDDIDTSKYHDNDDKPIYVIETYKSWISLSDEIMMNNDLQLF